MIRNCEYCNEEFKTSTASVRRFCSKACVNKSRIIHHPKQYICKQCNKEFISTYDDRVYCSRECHQKVSADNMREVGVATHIKKYGMHYNKTEQFKEQIHQAKLAGRYKHVAAKVKKTKLERYGDENYCNLDKSKQTKLERYEDEYYSNRDKCKQTKLERYGNSGYNNRNQCLKTMVLRYGVESPLQNLKIKQKMQNTLKQKYNVENVSQIASVKLKKNHDRKLKYYNTLLEGSRLNYLCTPLFTIDEYTGNEGKYNFKCNTCNHIFSYKIHNGLIPRCPKCFPYKYSSKAELEIIEFIKTLGITNIFQSYRRLIKHNEIDIYLPDYNLAIEFNGLYWHSERNGKDKNYHLNKTLECEKQGIHLLHIFEDEWLNKKDLVKQKLMAILNKSTNKIYARKCIIKEIDSKTKNTFLNLYHIQGEDKSKYKYGLFYNDELVSIMTFGSLRLALGNKTKNISYFELIRYASKYTVIGGASKLLKHFIKMHKPIKIISYADRRWTFNKDNLYTKIGFTKVSTSAPSYWYMKQHFEREYRFNYRKNVLINKLSIFNPDLSEWDNMQLNGYDRIWDCGTLKYELNFNITPTGMNLDTLA